MGTERTRSLERRAARAKLHQRNRETLVPCLGCEGEGMRGRTESDGHYRLVECPWCAGTKMMDARMLRNFIRYRRLVRACLDKGGAPTLVPPNASPGMRGGPTNGSAA